MDGRIAIEQNWQALHNVLTTLVAMAGLTATASGSHAGSVKTLPRHLYLAVLRLLRPAEAAARRLIIAAARTLVVTLPPARKAKPGPMPGFVEVPTKSVAGHGRQTGIAPPPGALRRLKPDGTVVWLFPTGLPPAPPPGRAEARPVRRKAAARPPVFSLFDPRRYPRPQRRRRTPAHRAPRISVVGLTERARLPSPPKPASPDDSIDATHLGLRLQALASALADLPGQALRFARWRARQDRALRQGRKFRLSPLRGGRPPGGRLSRYDPTARRRARTRDIDEILAHAHSLALFALQPPDTS